MTPERPKIAAPIFKNIPLELCQRKQWVCWVPEWRNGKMTKIPITPGTTSNARSNAPATWGTFEAAKASYLARPDYFGGIGYMFAKDDPYVGGDRDDNLSTEGLPPTYAEISPSGKGIKFIARARGKYGRKTSKGELYSSGRFFTITGNVLPGFERITECQEAVDAFLASLGGAEKESKGGISLTGTRAELVKQIPDEDWKAGARLHRDNLNHWLRRVRASAVSLKTRKDDTQLGLLLREDYEAFDKKFPYVGIYRADGSVDRSKVRAVVASQIRGRGFTFPQYVAVFFHLFGAECVAKWGTLDGFRQEAAACWLRGRSPRADEYKEAPPIAVKPGKGSDTDALRERIYQVLWDSRAGAQAVLYVQDIADTLDIDRRTVSKYLGELQEAGRIDYKQYKQSAGILVTFPGMINDSGMNNEMNGSGNFPHHNGVNAESHDKAITATNEERTVGAGVNNDTMTKESFSAAQTRETGVPTSENNRDEATRIYKVLSNTDLNNTSCVYSPASIIPENSTRNRVPTLAALASHYLSMPAPAIGRRQVNRRTGTFKYRRDAGHFAELVLADYGDMYSEGQAIEAYQTEKAYREELARQEWERYFKRLKAMSNEDLIIYVAGRLRSEVADLAREGGHFDKHLYKTRLKVAKQHLEWRGLELPPKGTRLKPYRKPKPKADPGGLVERLKRKRDERTEQQRML